MTQNEWESELRVWPNKLQWIESSYSIDIWQKPSKFASVSAWIIPLLKKNCILFFVVVNWCPHILHHQFHSVYVCNGASDEKMCQVRVKQCFWALNSVPSKRTWYLIAFIASCQAHFWLLYDDNWNETAIWMYMYRREIERRKKNSVLCLIRRFMSPSKKPTHRVCEEKYKWWVRIRRNHTHFSIIRF